MSAIAPLRVGWFSTGRGPGSRALLRAAADAIAAGLPVQIAYVFCNRERGEDPGSDEFMRLVDSLGLPLVTLSSAAFRRHHRGPVARLGEPLPAWRLELDDEALRLVRPYDAGIGVLAGYMLIFGPRACKELCLLNLHPAAPGGPIGIWQDVIWQLIDQRAPSSGITIFRAIPEVDAGPPLSYCTYSLRGPGIDELWLAAGDVPASELQATHGEDLPLFKEIRRRGATREPVLLVETLRHLATRRPFDLAALGQAPPMDLTAAVDAALPDA